MTKVDVKPGICKLDSTFEFDTDENMMVTISCSSMCPYIEKLVAKVGQVDPIEEIFSNILDTKVYQSAKDNIKHVSCPVPSAILKGVEIEANLALTQKLEIKITKKEE